MEIYVKNLFDYRILSFLVLNHDFIM